MRKWILVLILSFLIIAGFLYVKTKNENKYIEINSNKIYVEIAENPEKQYKGLSFREKLAQDQGMLFVFDNKQIRSFAMRNMSFPLDIIWINENKIVKIDKNLPPEGRITSHTYTSQEAIDRVLEVNGGLSDKLNIKTGDSINYYL